MYIQKSTSGTNAATTNPKSIIVSGCIHGLELVPLELKRNALTCSQSKPSVLGTLADSGLF